MRKLEKPLDSAEDVFIKCIDTITNKDLKSRLTSCKDLVSNVAKAYDEKASKQELHTITRTKTTKATKALKVINGQVTVDEMKNVYTSYFVPEGSPGRILYSKLLLAPSHGICPLCSQRIVSTLDHYLPKSQYPELSVVPVNLVPSCTDCNKDKLQTYPNNSEEETLHPYYDDIENDTWLSASVVKSTPASITFYVNPPATWDKLLSDRVKFHFSSFSLDKLYTTQAAVELTHINLRLNNIYSLSGKVGVRSHLLESAESRLYANKNSWQSALYNALTSDDWFCDGGFKF